jgi:transposase-like protein
MMSQTPSYRGYRFPSEIISHAVWLYCRFCVSFRDTEDLLAQRGITVSYETIRQWCRSFREPRRLATDKLRSYSAAHRTVLPSVVHRTDQDANNRAKVSHQPTPNPITVMRSTRQLDSQLTRPFAAKHREANVLEGRLLRSASSSDAARTVAQRLGRGHSSVILRKPPPF